MSTHIPEIVVAEGPLKGRRFAASAAGLRLGRSSSCEISLGDPALSRNHCLFEVRDAALWVTDLASANGTFVNGEPLGADSRALRPGDTVTAGETTLAIVAPGGEPEAAPDTLPPPAVDLGLGRPDGAAATAPRGRGALVRGILWALAVVAVAGAAALILKDGGAPGEVPPAPARAADDTARPALRTLAFEKVEASTAGICRYALALDADGTLRVAIDDVPTENRHVQKAVALSDAARARLEQLLDAPALYQLAPEYTGVPLTPGALTSYALRVVRGTTVFTTSIENTQEPEVFAAVRRRLEAFAANELDIRGLQYSTAQLLKLSEESRLAGDAKWAERDVQHGNLAAALAAYGEAVFYLETVNPKPADYGALVARRQEVAAELDRRYADQRFLADRAIHLADWAAAQRELRVLCDLVPDAKDPRHAEAVAKLLDVEARMKAKK